MLRKVIRSLLPYSYLLGEANKEPGYKNEIGNIVIKIHLGMILTKMIRNRIKTDMTLHARKIDGTYC